VTIKRALSTVRVHVLVLKSKLKKSTQKVNGYCASTCTLYTHSTTYVLSYEGTKYFRTFEGTFVLSYYVGLGFFDFFFLRPQSFSDFLAN